MSDQRAAALARLLFILESARRRKPMYFAPVEPVAVEHWLDGLRTGCSLAGLRWSPEDRRPALERRGLELTAAWEVEQLSARSLGPEAIVDELLAIEGEMWQHVGQSDAGLGAAADPASRDTFR
jgi:hypothetical protein